MRSKHPNHVKNALDLQGNNNAKPVSNSKGKRVESMSRSKPVESSNKLSAFGSNLGNNNIIQEFSLPQDVLGDDFDGDGIEMSVHASEDEFQDSDDELSITGEDQTAMQQLMPEAVEPGVEPVVNCTPIQRQNQPGARLPSTSTGDGAAAAKFILEQWKDNPEFKQLVGEVVRAGFNSGDIAMLPTKQKEPDVNQVTPGKQAEVATRVNNTNQYVKSPSETTLYNPALRRIRQDQTSKVDHIANFVEQMWIQVEDRQVQPAVLPHEDTVHDEEVQVDPELAAACQRMEKIILESEKFRANIATPQGNNKLADFKVPMVVDNNILRLRDIDNDDDFFHVTCHLDPGLKAKIELGEFVDLEKLLPKEKGGLVDFRTDNVMELISRGGSTYFAPKGNEVKINGIRKWEQAFRIYAAVYTKANPNRSAEIWEYVYVINAAASTHSWECVSFYDHTFRHLMAAKPMRSWSKTYLQGWNLALSHAANNNNNSSHGTGNNNSSGGGGGHDWCDDCCWRYNKNKCHKQGCHFDHRCTYCGRWNHGFSNCRKRLAKERRHSGSDRDTSNDQSEARSLKALK